MPGHRLSVFEREEIAVGLAGGESMSSIGRRLGRSPSTVSREVARNANRRGGYRALGAQRKAIDREIYRGGFGDPTKVLNRPRPHRKQRTRTGRYPHVLGDFKTIHQRPAS